MADAKEFFEVELPKKFEANPDKAEGMAGTYLFDIEGDGGGAWAVAFPEDGGMSVTPGAVDEPDCKISVATEDWGSILSGELDATTAFMSGKIRIEGDMAMAMKLQPILGE